jgi:hypothetical protein
MGHAGILAGMALSVEQQEAMVGNSWTKYFFITKPR